MAHTVNTAATEAVETLEPLVKAATQAAEAKRADALARLDRSSVRGRLLAALEAVDTTNADPAVIQQLAAMVPQHRVTVPNVLPGVLMAKHRANELKDDQCTVIAVALLALARGQFSAGLIQLDADWHVDLSPAQLQTLVGWVSPETLDKIEQDDEAAALDFASATYELGRLDKFAAAVDLLSAPAYKAQATVKLLNRTDRRFGVQGRQFEPGRAHPVERRELADMMMVPGFRSHVERGELEVIR
ncbi:hypothetical protein BCL93_105119 [Onishia taeanensis]|uniref:Uncharacterized protein n=1 Tax=Onishia taeanensis TaxID=284577 RepID=A0A328XQV1_9GAMM|nr:hypothetical protein [Halomonas taeanensis]RAR61518.1 hypothetical protein BCL93_105119 [Halomonas taeanensis]